MNFIDIEKLKELPKKMIELTTIEKKIEFKPFEWYHLKTHFSFGLAFLILGTIFLFFKSFLLASTTLSVGTIFMVNYHVSFKKWNHENQKLIKDYAQLYKKIKVQLFGSDENNSLQNTFQDLKEAEKKKHLTLLKND